MAGAPSSDTFDAIVIGAGPAGEVAVERLSDRGAKVALIEQELVGGECAYWACIPSKTLLRPGEVRHEAELAPGTSTPSIRIEDVIRYRNYMIRNLDDTGEVESYERRGVRVVKGRASLGGPGVVEVAGERLHAERIVIATGSEAKVPAIEGLRQAGYWTNREATTFDQVPDSVIVLGGGPVGIELSQLMRRLGADVHLLEAADRLLAREAPRVSELLLEALRADGIEVSLDADVTSVGVTDGGRTVEFGGRRATAQRLIVAIGRTPRTHELALESVGIEPGPGGIAVDDRCRAAEGIWAIGDVTGEMPFTHVAKYQARIACGDIAGEPVRADYAAVPRVVFSDPQVAAVGMSEALARDAGLDTATAQVVLPDAIARPWTYETEPRGELAVVVDRDQRILVGAWAVGPLASEWIHYAALAIKAQVPLAVLQDAVPQFPSYTEAYLKVIEKLEL
jgi:pyruvate/2-oxoglutarate dehydrogenase complex dihydrolipoamide dehydrogenase (E3) component